MSQIFENLYLGSYRDARDKTFLTSQKITHIVTVGIELKTRYPSKFNYLHIPAQDHFQFKLDDYFDDIADFIHKALHTDKGNVLVHCAQGVSRSATSVIAYLIKYHGMQFSEAKSFVQSKRKIIHPNRGFRQQLGKYYETIIANKDIKKKDHEQIFPKTLKHRNSRSVERKQDNQARRMSLSLSLTKIQKEKDNKSQYFCRRCQGNIFDGSSIINDNCTGIQDYSGMIYIQSASWMKDVEGFSSSKIFCPNPECRILLGTNGKNYGIYSCRVACARSK